MATQIHRELNVKDQDMVSNMTVDLVILVPVLNPI